MNTLLQALYEQHHQVGNREGFSFYGKKRGQWFAQQIGTGKRILDVGCRDGTLTQYYAKGNRVLGVDIDKRLLSRAKVKLGIETKHFDVYDDWDFKRRFDVVVAGEILEHLYYPDRMIAQCKRVLKPKGLLLVSVPNAYIISARVRFVLGQEIPAHSDPTHINLFSEAKLRRLLHISFTNVEIAGIAPPLYQPLHWLSNSWFADDLLAAASA